MSKSFDAQDKMWMIWHRTATIPLYAGCCIGGGFCAGRCLRERRIETTQIIEMKQKDLSSDLVKKVTQFIDAAA